MGQTLMILLLLFSSIYLRNAQSLTTEEVARGQTNVCKPDESYEDNGNALANSILISGGIVVNAEGQINADVLIKEGKIVAIEPQIPKSRGEKVIDATGKFVMPGGIDPHTHLAMPFMGTETIDDFKSGQSAALAGGTTFHIDFALPTAHNISRGLLDYFEKSKNAVMDYGFHMAITDWNDDIEREMKFVVENGVNSFKFFLAYKGALQVTDEQLLNGFQRCKDLGALPQVHAENGDAVEFGRKKVFEMGITGPEGHAISRPSVLEGEATSRAIKLAKFLNVPLYVVHVMSEEALSEIAKARLDGQRVIGEPVVSGLALDESVYFDSDFKKAAMYVMSPPIRSKSHQKALKSALSNGILQLVATDHCTFNSSQKSLGKNDFRLIPNGVNGIGERMHIVWEVMVNSGLISPSDYVRITSTACAKIFNIYPQKGVIAVGSDADIIILDPKRTTEISAVSSPSKTDTNVYEGWKIKGNIEVTISRGRVVYSDGKLTVEEGSGRFVPLKPFGPLFDDLDKLDDQIRSSLNAPVDRP